MFLLWSLLASGCWFGRRVQEAFKKNRLSTNGRIKFLFIPQMSTYYVAGTVLEAWDTLVDLRHTQNPCPCAAYILAGVTQWDRVVLRTVVGCPPKYFVLGWHQRPGDSLAETERQGVSQSISERGAFWIEETRGPKALGRECAWPIVGAAQRPQGDWSPGKEGALGWREVWEVRGSEAASIGLHFVQKV